MPTAYTAAGQNDNLTTDAGLPGSAGDSLYVGAGARDYSAGTDVSGVDYLTVAVTGGFTGNFLEAYPLTVTCNRTGTGVCSIAFGGRTCYVQSSGPAGVIATLKWAPTRNGRGYLSNATITKGVASSGSLQSAASASVTTWIVNGNCQLTLLEGSTTSPNLTVCDFAQVEIQTQIGTLAAYGNASVRITKGAVTPSSITWGSTGTLYYQGGSTTINMNGGTIDLSQIKGPISITRTVNGKTVIVLSRTTEGLITWTSTDNVTPEIRYA